jgi:hypothetical protein
VCTKHDDEVVTHYATGIAKNAFAWSRFAFEDEMEVVPCHNHTAPKDWIFVDDVVPCPEDARAKCKAGAKQQQQ